MGYPAGEIPMLSVHGQTVAGSTFPVPIWHDYMSSAEWRRPAREFLEPKHELTYRTFEHTSYGYTASLAPVYVTPAETTATTETDSTPGSPATTEQTPKPEPSLPATEPAPPAGPKPAE